MSDGGHFFSKEEIILADTISAEINQLPAKLDNAVLFGAGAIGRSLLWNFRRHNLHVGGIVDNNPALWGKTIDGIPVFSFTEYQSAMPDSLLVLALSKGFREVREQCRAVGLEKRLVPHYLCRAALGIVPFAQRMSAEAIERDPQAAEALNMWFDDASREKYRKLVRFQALFNDDDLPAEEDGHYFSSNYMPRRFLHSVADVGACDGDTLREFLIVSGGQFNSYRAFEPDPENFRKLEASVPHDDKRFYLYTFGLDAEPGIRRMRDLGTLLSSIGDDGGTWIKVDSLDNISTDDSITLIKMDVEGHELHALDGAVNTIRRCRPALALSMYHQVDHLWLVPLRVREIISRPPATGTGYRFRVGCHGDLYSEAVCYAIPE